MALAIVSGVTDPIGDMEPALRDGHGGGLMHLVDGRTVFSASDLADFLDCEHLTTLGNRVLAGELKRPHFPDPTRDVLEEKGRQHEQRHQFYRLSLCVPPCELQERFEMSVAPLMARRTVASRESTVLAQTRDTLLPRLLSGELSVPTAEAALEATA